MELRRTIWPLLMLVPGLIIFTLFVYLPTFISFALSLTDYDLVKFSGKFVGLENYRRILFGEFDFLPALFRTFGYAMLVVPGAFFFALLLSVLVTSDLIVGKPFLRAVFYLPWLLSPSIIGIMWKWFLDYDAGLLNLLALKIGLNPIPFLLDAKLAFLSVSLLTIWNISGYFMIMFVSAMTSIPKEIYEAASIDGATRWVRFWKITFPLIRPTSALILLIATIMALRSFEVVYVFTAGGPGSATTMVAQRIYQTAFFERRLGLATSMAVVVFIILFSISLIQLKLLEERR